MAHVIPLSVGQRRLETGNAPQYPQGSPIGGTMLRLGDLSAVAARYQQMKDQQDGFNAEIARRKFNAEIAQAEQDVAANAPPDGSGMHETMYGQVDPYTGQVVKSGLFDKLFDNFLTILPESKRSGFISQKEPMRAVGAMRTAQVQMAKRDGFENAYVDTELKTSATAIAQGDPNDIATFEAIRQSGSDLIAKIGNPLIRQATESAWRTNAAKALVQAMIAQDPKRAAELLGAAQDGARTKAGGAETVGGSHANANSSAVQKVDPLGTTTPEEGIEAVDRTTLSDSKTAIPLDTITYLRPGDIAALKDQANNANAAQMIGANARVMLAEQNAPAVIAATGKYPEDEPTAQDFVGVYGAEVGSKRFEQFRITSNVAKAYSAMYPASNQAIHAELREAEPGPDGSPEEHERYEIKAGAARLIMAARDADPVAYVSQLFRDNAPDWSKASTPQDFQAAFNWAGAAQRQLGFGKVLAVPQAIADGFGERYVNESIPLQERVIELSEKLKAIRDPKSRFIFVGQVFQGAMASLRQSAAENPKITPAELEARGKALEAELIEMAGHPARARFNAAPWWQKPIVAVNDDARLIANSATFHQADKFSAAMSSFFSDQSYDEALAAQLQETEDAEDRAGSASIPLELLGAFATGHGFQSVGMTFTGRLAAEGLKGIPGLLARSSTAAADGAVFGGLDAALNGRDIVSEMGAGALSGAGGNALAEGLTAVGGQVVRRLTRRQADSGPSVAEGRAGDAGIEALEEGASEGTELHQGAELSKPTPELAAGHDLHLNYMPEWDEAQRAAADLKVKILTEADTVVSRAVRLFGSARRRFIAAGNAVRAGSHVDHRVDLQLGGSDTVDNMALLDASVNTSLGSQINHLIKHLPKGTKINKVTIGDRSVRDIPEKLPGR